MQMAILRRLIICAALVVGLLGGNAYADHGQVSEAELKALFTGATAHGKTTKGAKYTTKFTPDGSIILDVATGFKDTGKWRIDGNTYCATLKKSRKGTEACWEVIHRSGDAYHLKNFDGRASSNDVNVVR